MADLSAYNVLGNRFGITGPNYGAAGHRGQDFKVAAGAVIPAYETITIVDSDRYTAVLGYVVVGQAHSDGRYIGWAHVRKGTRPARGAVLQPGDQVGLVAGFGDDHGSAWTGPHIHTTLGPTLQSIVSGVTYDPLPRIQAAVRSVTGAGTIGGVILDYGYGLTKDAQLAAQTALSDLGYYNGKIDGAFGDMSVSAFQQYLKDNSYLPGDYDVDGQPGPLYGGAIQKLAAKYGYTGKIDNEPGSLTSAAIVKWAAAMVVANIDHAYGLTKEAQLAIQQALTELGYYAGQIDGDFGVLSVKAFQEYLKANGYLPGNYNPDGIPGPTYGGAVQNLAQKYGYTGPIDNAPGASTSTALVKWAQTVLVPTQPTTLPPLPGTLGIDIATGQSGIDLAKAKEQGIKFVIVKLGGLNVEPQYVSPYYTKQVDAARANGLAVGHYYVVGTGQTPEQQAEFFVNNLRNFDKDHDVLALDNEVLDKNGTFFQQDDAARFLKRVIELTGTNPKRVWLYIGANDARTKGPWNKVTDLGVRLWWAAYGGQPTNLRPDHEPSLQGSFPDWHVHQFSSVSNIGGVQDVDTNYSRLSVDELFNLPAPVVVPPVVIPPVVDPDEPEIPSEPETPTEPETPDEPETAEPERGSNAWVVGLLNVIAAAVTALIAWFSTR